MVIIFIYSTRLQATTISALLIIGGIEINPGPGSTTEEDICSMEIEECSQSDVIIFSSQTVQHTPISSQVVPLNDLDLSSQCSDVPITPEKSIPRKRRGYRARKDRNRAAIKRNDLMTQSFVKLRTSLVLHVSIKIVRILIS